MTEPAVELLDETWSNLVALGEGFDEATWKQPSELPGWTLQDVVSHVIGTERMLLGEERPPPPPDGFGPHVRNQIGEWNECWVAARRDRPGAAVLAELREVTDARRRQLAAMTTEQFDEVGFTPEGQGPYRQFMEIRVFDCWLHEQDLRRVAGRPGSLDNASARHSVARMVPPMAYVVGKRAAAPDGSSVTFAVTGAQQLLVPVVVRDGRAAVVEEAPGEPTATIEADVEAFVALASGRWDADRALASGKVRLEGDDALGRRVLASMGYTI